MLSQRRPESLVKPWDDPPWTACRLFGGIGVAGHLPVADGAAAFAVLPVPQIWTACEEGHSQALRRTVFLRVEVREDSFLVSL